MQDTATKISREAVAELTRNFRPSERPAGNPIGRRVQQRMHELRLSRARVAKLLDVPYQTFRNWILTTHLQSQRWPNFPAGAIWPLSRILRCDPLWLLCIHDEVGRPDDTRKKLAIMEAEIDAIMEAQEVILERARRFRKRVRQTTEQLSRHWHNPYANRRLASRGTGVRSRERIDQEAPE